MGVSPNILPTSLLTSYCSHVSTPISNCKECGGKYKYNIIMGVGSQHIELQLGELKEKVETQKLLILNQVLRAIKVPCPITICFHGLSSIF